MGAGGFGGGPGGNPPAGGGGGGAPGGGPPARGRGDLTQAPVTPPRKTRKQEFIQYFKIHTAGHKHHGIEWNRWKKEESLEALADELVKVESERSPPCFDILLDTTLFSDTSNTSAGHVGHHVSIIEEIVNDDKRFKAWWEEFQTQYSDIPARQTCVNVLIVCPSGRELSVAGAEVMLHILTAIGKAVPNEIVHFSRPTWFEHSMCRECQDHRQQRRWNEVMAVAVRKATY